MHVRMKSVYPHRQKASLHLVKTSKPAALNACRKNTHIYIKKDIDHSSPRHYNQKKNHRKQDALLLTDSTSYHIQVQSNSVSQTTTAACHFPQPPQLSPLRLAIPLTTPPPSHHPPKTPGTAHPMTHPPIHPARTSLIPIHSTTIPIPMPSPPSLIGTKPS